MSIVELHAVTRTYDKAGRRVTALNGVTLMVEPGQLVTILGPSGAGKSTLLNLIGTLDRPSQGEYLFDGKAVSSLTDTELARTRAREMGFIFQSYNLLPYLKAWQNVALPNRFSRYLAQHEARERALELLDVVGLRERAEHYPSELSGGEEQRVAIARALMNHPKLILADEPTGNLDSVNHEMIMGLLSGVRKQNTTVIVVSHNSDFAELADRVVTIRDGSLADA